MPDSPPSPLRARRHELSIRPHPTSSGPQPRWETQHIRVCHHPKGNPAKTSDVATHQHSCRHDSHSCFCAGQRIFFQPQCQSDRSRADSTAATITLAGLSTSLRVQPVPANVSIAFSGLHSRFDGASCILGQGHLGALAVPTNSHRTPYGGDGGSYRGKQESWPDS